MQKIAVPLIWGIHAVPPPKVKWLLAVLPFILIVGMYAYASYVRHLDNPRDRILPSFSKMAETAVAIAFHKDAYSGEYIVLNDTYASLKRIFIGTFAAMCMGLLFGINLGIFPGLRVMIRPLFAFLSIVPPFAILPIIFIVFGMDEFAKIMLVFFCTFPSIAEDVYLATEKTPREQITKALTLGVSQLQLVYRVVRPQLMPRLIEATRISLRIAWSFLLASEMIAASVGLGYRIFIVRRYTAMDIIIPYVLWITFLGFSIDWSLKKFVTWKYPWYFASQD